MVEAIFILAAILAVAAIPVSVWANGLSSSRRKARANFAGAALFSLAFCVAGLALLIGIHTSKRSFAVGIITGLNQTHGKNSHSRFYVLCADGTWLAVRSDYDGDHLINGETASVEVLNFESTLLHLKVLGGEYDGWALNESDGTIGACFVLGLGCFLIFAARKKWRRDPEAFEEYDDGRTPKNGVDEKSCSTCRREMSK